MKKTFKVIMLPTEKASRICILASNKLNYGAEALASNNTTLQHLYIISDDEIKEGDWFTTSIDSSKYHHNTPIHQCTSRPKDKDEVFNWVSTREFTFKPESCKKIVATTDKSLGYTDHRISPVPNFCDYPQLPESFIQAYIKAYNEGKPITEVDLEMTKTIKESRPGVYEINLPIIEVIKTRTDNTVIISEVKEYRKREMEKCIESPYYFYTQYCIINGERAQSILNEKEFNELWKRFRKI